VRRVLRPGGRLGLIWNGPDPRDLWEYDLARLDPDTGGRDFVADPADGAMEVPGLPADELEAANFPWLREIDGALLRGRLRTHSAFVVMEPDERERRIDSMVAVVTAEAARRGTATVPLRQSAHCVRWQPAPSPGR
jgi:SAM-dependent methyltransferase